MSWLKGHGIEHIYSSAYNSSSNGNVERAVRSIKDVIKKEGNPSDQRLEQILFFLNSHRRNWLKQKAIVPVMYFRLGTRLLCKIQYLRSGRVQVQLKRQGKQMMELNIVSRSDWTQEVKH